MPLKLTLWIRFVLIRENNFEKSTLHVMLFKPHIFHLPRILTVNHSAMIL